MWGSYVDSYVHSETGNNSRWAGKEHCKKRKGYPAVPLGTGHQTGMGAEVCGEAGFQASARCSENQKGKPRALESPRDNVERKKLGRASPQSWSETSSGSPSGCTCVDLILISQALRPQPGPRRLQEAHTGQIRKALLSSKDRSDTVPQSREDRSERPPKSKQVVCQLK